MTHSPIVLTVEDLQWVHGPADDPEDHCAHGRVRFEVGESAFVRPEDGIWTVSASALYLLRTLTADHTAQQPVAEANLLFPCCGFSVWPVGTRYRAMIVGCPSGIDVDVVWERGAVTFRSSAGTARASADVWREAVVGFAEQVLAFYQRCAPKAALSDSLDREGWDAFWQEWQERLQAARAADDATGIRGGEESSGVAGEEPR